MVKKKKSKKIKQEKVCEVFSVEKDGKKVMKKSCGDEGVIQEKKGQTDHHNNILKYTLIAGAIVIIGALIIFYSIDSMKEFTYEGIEFERIKSGEIIFYHSVFPMYEDGKHVSNFDSFIRNDPRFLGEKVEFKGEFRLRELAVINSTMQEECDKGIIAVANMKQVLNGVGTKLIRDLNASCDEQGRYLFFQLQDSEENSIEQYSDTCYNINVKDCDILKSTERFILELLTKVG